MLDLVVRPEARAWVDAQNRRALALRLRTVLCLLDRARSQVTLLLTGDREIRELNRTYRKLDRATDVLSFHQHDLEGEADPAGDGVFLGDIVISVETVLRRGRGKRLAGELARVATHGLCHLFGHDHHRPAPARRMRKLEDRLLRASRPKRIARRRAVAG
jgi:probable rRNA maturation factor